MFNDHPFSAHALSIVKKNTLILKINCVKTFRNAYEICSTSEIILLNELINRKFIYSKNMTTFITNLINLSTCNHCFDVSLFDDKHFT